MSAFRKAKRLPQKVLDSHPDRRSINRYRGLYDKIINMSWSSGFCFIGNQKLALSIEYSARTVVRGIQALRDAGILMTIYGYARNQDRGEDQNTIRCLVPAGGAFYDGYEAAKKFLSLRFFFVCRSKNTDEAAALRAVWKFLGLQALMHPGSEIHACNDVLRATRSSGAGSWPELRVYEKGNRPELIRRFWPGGMDKNGELTPFSPLKEEKGFIAEEIETYENCELGPGLGSTCSSSLSPSPAIPGEQPGLVEVDWLLQALRKILPNHPENQWSPESVGRLRGATSKHPVLRDILKFIEAEIPSEFRENALITDLDGYRKLINFAKPVAGNWRQRHIEKYRRFLSGCLETYESLEMRMVRCVERASEDAFQQSLVGRSETENLIAHRIYLVNMSGDDSGVPIESRLSGELLVSAIRYPQVWRHLLHDTSLIPPGDFLDVLGFERSDLVNAVKCQIEFLARDAEKLQDFTFLDVVKHSGYSKDLDRIPDPEAYRLIDPCNISLSNYPKHLLKSPQMKPRQSE